MTLTTMATMKQSIQMTMAIREGEEMKKILKDEKGNALIQTAVVIPMILGLFMGLVFFCNAYRYKIVMTMATKEGARAYAISHDEQVAVGVAREELSVGRVRGVNFKVESDGTFVASKPYGFTIPLYGKHLFNLKAQHKAKKELEYRYYKKMWNPKN